MLYIFVLRFTLIEKDLLVVVLVGVEVIGKIVDMPGQKSQAFVHRCRIKSMVSGEVHWPCRTHMLQIKSPSIFIHTETENANATLPNCCHFQQII